VMNDDGSLSFNFNDSNSPIGGGKKTCPFCFQQLSWHALSRHIRDMHRAKSDLVTCKYCMKTFRNKNSLGCHIWRFHKRGKELIGKDNSFDGWSNDGNQMENWICLKCSCTFCIFTVDILWNLVPCTWKLGISTYYQLILLCMKELLHVSVQLTKPGLFQTEE